MLFSCAADPAVIVRQNLIEAEAAIKYAKSLSPQTAASVHIEKAERLYAVAVDEYKAAPTETRLGPWLRERGRRYEQAAVTALMAKQEADRAVLEYNLHRGIQIDFGPLPDPAETNPAPSLSAPPPPEPPETEPPLSPETKASSTNAAPEQVEALTSEIQRLKEELQRRQSPEQTPKEIYNNAFFRFHDMDYAASRKGFTNFIDRFPDHPLSDNAAYWRSETFYSQKRYREALTGFQSLLKRYPESNKRADALLKITLCHQHLNQPEAANAALDRLLRRYPRSRAARIGKMFR
jgi:tol-pal system protein YbgF